MICLTVEALSSTDGTAGLRVCLRWDSSGQRNECFIKLHHVKGQSSHSCQHDRSHDEVMLLECEYIRLLWDGFKFSTSLEIKRDHFKKMKL